MVEEVLDSILETVDGFCGLGFPSETRSVKALMMLSEC